MRGSVRNNRENRFSSVVVASLGSEEGRPSSFERAPAVFNLYNKLDYPTDASKSGSLTQFKAELYGGKYTIFTKFFSHRLLTF